MSTIFKNKKKIIAGIILLFIISILLFSCKHIKEENTSVIEESQAVVEQSNGIKETAKKNNIYLSDGQSKEISAQLQNIRIENVKPDYVVPTTGKEVKKAAEEHKGNSDFSIITDKKDPDKKVDLASIPDEEKVELNQYNIYTSPKVLREVSVGKDVNNGSTVVGFGIKKRIAKEGKYIGISVMQELQQGHHTIVMASYSW